MDSDETPTARNIVVCKKLSCSGEMSLGSQPIGSELTFGADSFSTPVRSQRGRFTLHASRVVALRELRREM